MLLVAVYWGIGTADTVWSGFLNYLPKSGGVIYATEGPQGQAQLLARKALINEVAYVYIARRTNQKISEGWSWSGGEKAPSGQWIYGAALNGNSTIDSGLGTVTLTCGTVQQAMGWRVLHSAINIIDGHDLFHFMGQTTANIANWWQSHNARIGTTSQTGLAPTKALTGSAKYNIACLKARGNAATLVQSMHAIAEQLVPANGQQGVMPNPALFNEAIDAFIKNRSSNLKEYQKYQQAGYTESLKNFASSASDLGWVSSAMFWWTLTHISQAAETQLKYLTPTARLASRPFVNKTTQGYQSGYMKKVNTYLQLAGSPTLGSVKSTANTAGNNNNTNIMYRWFGSMLYSIPKMMMGGNLLVNLANVGHTLITVGGSIYAVAVGSALAASLKGAFVGGLAGSGVEPGGGTLVGAVAGGVLMAFVSSLGAGAVILGSALIVEGAVFAYVIPMMPAIIMTLAVIGWLLLVVELMVAAPLWAAAHAFAEGEGFAPQQARHGYSVAIGIVMRPTLLVFGFVFAYMMIQVGGNLLGMVLMVFVWGMTGNSIGPVAFATLLA